jgi:hypothetical protein
MSGKAKLQLGGIVVGGSGVGETGVGGTGVGPVTGPPGVIVPELEPEAATEPEPPAYGLVPADEAGGETGADVPVASCVPGAVEELPEPSAPDSLLGAGGMDATAPPQAEPSATASDNQMGIPDLDITPDTAGIVLVGATAISMAYEHLGVPR